MLSLPLTQQSVIDENAGELVAHSALHQSRSNSRIDAARQSADDAPVTNLTTNLRDLVADDRASIPVRTASGNVEKEVLEHRLSGLRVVHFGVPLHANEPALNVFKRRHRRTRSAGQRRKSLRGTGDGIAVTHPHADGVGNTGQKLPRGRNAQAGASILRCSGMSHLTAESLGHGLESIADAQHRHTSVKQRRVDARGALCVDRGRTTRKNNGGGFLSEHVAHWHVMRDDLGVNIRLTHPAGNELGVLRAEVDHQNDVVKLFHEGESMAHDPTWRHSRSPYWRGSLIDRVTRCRTMASNHLSPLAGGPRLDMVWFIHRQYSPAEPRLTYEH